MVSCASEDSANDGTGQDEIAAPGPTENRDKGGRSTCEHDAECAGEEICHPQAGVCVARAGTCSAPNDCPTGHACDQATSRCLLGLIGTGCEEDQDCQPGTGCEAGVCACSGFEREQETLAGPLDIYFVFDRTRSMGQDCEYQHGTSPPTDSKACFSTYAMSNYLIDASPQVDTRLALQFMSYEDSCDGGPYQTPLVPLTRLPITAEHAMAQAINEETFDGGAGTQIEGALNGIAHFTTNNLTPGREMIGVLMTDGDPTDHCTQDISELAAIISNHRNSTGLRTFIIGMEGATEENLEELAVAGGAEPHDDFCGDIAPPCHYWNVESGEGEALSNALTAIVGQASPLPCEYGLAEIKPVDGQELDLSTLNVQLSQTSGTTIISNVSDASSCPAAQHAWHYDDAAAPKQIILCPATCDLVTSADASARMSIVGGCQETMMVR